MSDLPTFGNYQQAHASPVSGEHLEVLGKQASARWASGEYKTLTEAVVETVKEAGLSPEQVKRVIEFTNTDAYLREFKKEGQDHKFIDFGHGGPADPGEIIRDLNDGGGGSVFDRGTTDYRSPPSETKTASINGERELVELFGTPNVEHYPHADPLGDVIDLRSKLATVYAHVGDQISGLEIMYADLADRVFHGVKQASLEGHSLGEVVQAWGEVAPSAEHVKVAFQLLTPRLIREEVFRSTEDIGSSLQKTASAQVVNKEHPLVVDFDEYCQTLSKLAELRGVHEETKGYVKSLNRFMEKAAGPGGVVHAVHDALGKAGKGIGGGVKAGIEKAMGRESDVADLAGGLTSHAVGNADRYAAAYVGNELLGGRPGRIVNSYMPWSSQEKDVRRQMGVGALI